MARNASGTYTLPIASYIAATTIKSADMNSNLSDMATALTQSLATTGVSSMTGPLKLAAGTAAAPSLTLASDTTTGWYNSAAGSWTYVSSGTTIFTLASTGGTITNLTVTNLTVTGSFSVASARVVGEIIDYGGTSAPALWLLCYGQAISRTTYSSLFGVIGTAFGVGDGVTTFNAPDLRGRVTVGKDDMGGVAASRITNAECGIVGTTLGAAGGVQSTVLTTAQLPVHTHTPTDPGHLHLNQGSANAWTSQTVNGPVNPTGSGTGIVIYPATMLSAVTGITIGNAGSGTTHTNVQPSQVVNKIIYAAV
jgi:microcystin-dependent protein